RLRGDGPHRPRSRRTRRCDLVERRYGELPERSQQRPELVGHGKYPRRSRVDRAHHRRAGRPMSRDVCPCGCGRRVPFGRGDAAKGYEYAKLLRDTAKMRAFAIAGGGLTAEENAWITELLDLGDTLVGWHADHLHKV